MARHLSRRLALSLAAGGLLTARTSRVAGKQATGSPTLRELADRKGFALGELLDPNRILAVIGPGTQTGYNTVLLDGPLHWQHLYSSSGSGPNFTSADQLAKHATASGMTMEVHHLNHGGFERIDRPAASVPKWVPERVAADGGDPMPLLRENITAVLSHFGESYPGLVSTFTVVNESVNPWGSAGDFDIYLPDGTVVPGRNFWNQASLDFYGDPWFYVGESFRITAEVNAALGQTPNLIINEYGAEQPDTSKGDAYLYLVSSLVESGVPINGVGFQMHLRSGDQYENGVALWDEGAIDVFAAEFQRQMERFPVPPFITEMEIDPAGWVQMGYAPADAKRLVGYTIGRVLQALIAAGGSSLMFMDATNITGYNTLPENDPNSAVNVMTQILSQLPDV